MNPFDLRGPEFLLFYLVLSVITIGGLVFFRRRAESGPAPKLDLSDAYLIAYLRGGARETLRVAVLSLIDRGWLKAENTMLRRTARKGFESLRNPLEITLLNRFSKGAKAWTIHKDGGLKAACRPYRDSLERASLMPNQELRNARWLRFWLGLAILGFSGLAKIAIGISRGRPIAFLVLLLVAVTIAAALASFPRLTMRGNAVLQDLRTLYGGLRERAASLRPGGSTTEMAMLAAVYGISALPLDPYPHSRQLFPEAYSSSSGSSCGSGSSSSCSSGGGCGGGGGGGCGGCGS